jgi:hypothetical protein
MLSIHGSGDRLAAQAPPDWTLNAKFYDTAEIKQLFGDKAFTPTGAPNPTFMRECNPMARPWWVFAPGSLLVETVTNISATGGRHGGDHTLQCVSTDWTGSVARRAFRVGVATRTFDGRRAYRQG